MKADLIASSNHFLPALNKGIAPMKSQQVMVKIYPIRLGQFLKFANVTSDGIESKILITENKVMVNSVVETRRGRQLKKGDLVFVNDISYLCS